jgi:glucokinase
MTEVPRPPWLVADIGGTNARFALADPDAGRLTRQLTLPTSTGHTLVDLTRDYLARADVGPVDAACFDCAGPITGDRCFLTNAAVEVSIEQTRSELGLRTLLVVNDFAAAARSIPELGSEDVVQVGDVRPKVDRGAVAIGPGTGLGVATIVPTEAGWRVLAGEGGHVALSGLHDDELDVVRALRKRWGYASAEMVLSGPGLTRLYLTLLEIRGEAPLPENDPRPDLIVERATSRTDATSVAALTMFCELLATTAANAALTTGAVGGVYLAGGIVRRFPDFVVQSGFRERFTAHPHASAYLQQVGTVIVTAPEPGLLGAMHLLAAHERRPGGGSAIDDRRPPSRQRIRHVLAGEGEGTWQR